MFGQGVTLREAATEWQKDESVRWRLSFQWKGRHKGCYVHFRTFHPSGASKLCHWRISFSLETNRLGRMFGGPLKLRNVWSGCSDSDANLIDSHAGIECAKLFPIPRTLTSFRGQYNKLHQGQTRVQFVWKREAYFLLLQLIFMPGKKTREFRDF